MKNTFKTLVITGLAFISMMNTSCTKNDPIKLDIHIVKANNYESASLYTKVDDNKHLLDYAIEPRTILNDTSILVQEGNLIMIEGSNIERIELSIKGEIVNTAYRRVPYGTSVNYVVKTEE